MTRDDLRNYDFDAVNQLLRELHHYISKRAQGDRSAYDYIVCKLLDALQYLR